MKLSHLLLVIILSCATAFATSFYLARAPKSEVVRETSYQRILRTNTLRCGYQYWDSAVMRDEQTGQLHGAWVDIMDAIGHATGLKIEWAEQVGWDDVGEALKTKKIDAMCAGMWTSAAKAKEIAFSIPASYQGIEAFVRTDDHRFDNGLAALDDAGVTIAVIDNDNSDFIAMQDFPKAKKLSLSQLSGTDGDLLMQVAMGKADVTFSVTGMWQQFDKNNSGKVRRLAPDHLLRIFGLSVAVDNDDPRLLQMINAGIQETQNGGFLDKIIDRADHDYPNMYIKPGRPF